MNPNSLAMTLLAIAITSAGSAARAQPVIQVPGQTLQGVFTLVSPPAAPDPTFTVAGIGQRCQVTNISSQTVILRRLQIYAAGSVRADANCAGSQAALQPGHSCTVAWSSPVGQDATAESSHCRAVFVGTRAGAVAGTTWVIHQGLDIDNGRAIGVTARHLQALQPVEGISLAP